MELLDHFLVRISLILADASSVLQLECMWTNMAANQHFVHKMIKEVARVIIRGCVRRIHTDFFGCLLGSLSARIVRSYS